MLTKPDLSTWPSSPTMAVRRSRTKAVKLPRRALVLGLARSGQPPRSRWPGGRADVAADRAADVETGRLAEAGVEVHPGNEDEGLLDGVELLVKSPGVPGESPLVGGCTDAGSRSGARSSSAPACCGTRSSASPARTARRRRASCSARCSGRGRPVAVAGNVGRPLTGFDGALDRALDRVRALELPARGRPRATPARRCPAQPRAGPPRPPRHVRGLSRREAPHLREPPEDVASSRAASAPFPAPAARVLADDPLPAEPRSRAGTTARTLRQRPPPRGRPASTTRRSRAASGLPGRRAPARARRRDRRRPLRQRLEGHEHGRCATRIAA